MFFRTMIQSVHKMKNTTKKTLNYTSTDKRKLTRKSKPVKREKWQVF